MRLDPTHLHSLRLILYCVDKTSVHGMHPGPSVCYNKEAVLSEVEDIVQ